MEKEKRYNPFVNIISVHQSTSYEVSIINPDPIHPKPFEYGLGTD